MGGRPAPSPAGGLVAGVSDLLTGVVLGPPEQQDATKQAVEKGGLLGGLGETLSGLPEKAGAALGESGFVGAMGEGLNTVTNVLGRDPISGRQLSGWERALPLAGLAGLGLGTAMWLGKGPKLWHGTRPSQWSIDWANDTGAVGFTGPNIAGRRGITSQIEPPVQPLPGVRSTRIDEDVLWGTVSSQTNRFLSVRPQPEHGFNDLASAVLRDAPADQFTVDRTRAYTESFGRRLLEEVPAHTQSSQLHMLPEQAPLAAAAYEMARWQWAIDHKIGNSNLLQGSGAKRAVALWERFRAGEELSPENTQKLMDAQVRFADAVQWIEHPELAIHPLVGVNRITMDDAGNVDVGLKVLNFDAKGWDRVTPKDLNDRFSAMFALNPGALVDYMRANITEFFQGFVQPDVVEKFRNWYPAAKRDITKVANATGVDPNRLTALASILSAEETWETNVQKAAQVMQVLEPISALPPGQRAGVLGRAVKQLNAIGVKASRDDVTRSLLLWGVPDAGEFFFTGKRTGGMSLSQIASAWESGQDLAGLVRERTRGADYAGLKQPSFWFGIWHSDPSDLEDQARALNAMLRGELWTPGEKPIDSRAAFHGDVRGQLPVVTDRQAFKVALGVNAIPETWLSGQKGPYDATSQAYRLAAAEIGDIGGRQLLPGELQAITWMELRRHTGVVGPDLEPYLKGDRARLRAAGEDVTPIDRWPASGGVRPMVFNDRIVNLALNGTPEAVRWGDVAGDLTQQVRPSDLNGQRPSLDAARDVIVRSNADGTTQVLGGPDVAPETFRGLAPTRAFDSEGRQVWVRAVPYQVDDIDAEIERLSSSTRTTVNPDGKRLLKPTQGATGATIMRADSAPNLPWQRPGYWMMVMPKQSVLDEATGRTVKTAEESQRELLARMSQRGISPKSVEVLHPVTGRAPGWQDENRVPMLVEFHSVDDMSRAHGLFYEPSASNGVKPFQSGFVPTPDNGAAGYIRQFGGQLGLQNRRVNLDVQADPKVGRELADIYDKAPVFEDTPQVRRAWRSLARETEQQYRYLTETLGVKVEFVDADPYPNMQAMRRDVLENNTLKVYKTAGDQEHPLLTNEQNDMFRAVHDYFGHAAMGNDFSRHGEEVAWAKHSIMFSRSALPAMTAETRAQNSYLNFSRANEARRAQGLDAQFGEQKVFWVPEKFWSRPDVYEPGKLRTWADELMPEEFDDASKSWHVEVPSVFLYVNGPGEAPPGTTRVVETHFQGPNGYAWNLSTSADHARSASGAVYVGDEFLNYLKGQEVTRLQAGGGGHRFVDSGQGLVLDGQIAVSTTHGPKVTAPKSADGFWAARVDGKAPKVAVVAVPEAGMAQVFYGANNPTAVGADPLRSAVVKRTSNGVTVTLPTQAGKVSVGFANQVENLLRRVGVTTPVTFRGSKA